MALSMTVTGSAAQESAEYYIQQMLRYYQHHQEDAALDISLLLAELEKLDADRAAIWKQIMDFWAWLNEDMEIQADVLPDGLPEDESLCIVVLGYRLNADGSITDELEGRLQVALDSAEKYPNAYILCTGGATASKNRNVTEAGQMAKWLIRRGIAEDRVIVEGRALDTIENARNSLEILRSTYPQVKHLAVITSDYHIYRGALYVFTQSALSACESGGEVLSFVGNATYRTGNTSRTPLATQAEGISILAGIPYTNSDAPSLSRLESISVTGTTVYESGAEPELTVTANYSSGYSLDVTQSAKYLGLDFGASGQQTVTVSYSENDTVKSATIDIAILPPPSPETEPAEEAAALSAPESEAESEEPFPVIPIVFAAAALIWGVYLIWDASQKKKRRRPRPKLDLN